MAYVKHGTGPNDHKKGNRTRGKDRRGNRTGSPNEIRNTTGLQEASKNREEFIDKYRKIAEERERITKYNQEYVSDMAWKISDYIEECHKSGEPLTVSGMLQAGGLTSDAYSKGKNYNQYDHMLYIYMDLHGIDYDREGTIFTDENGKEVLLSRMSDILKRAELEIMKEREIRCSSTKGNPAGNIFLLKGFHGIQDTPQETRTTNNNTLVLNNVASLEEARDALKRLNG